MSKIEIGEILLLEGEDGQDQEIEILGTLDVDGAEYAVAGLVEEIKRETDEDMEIFFFRVDDEGELHEIESDEEFQKVASVLENNLKHDH
ncbi:DUF1292 domain-containing protein [Pradoshia eiseniae]|uniref:DUF1292 domain-containing protein n=1 Tax=Pradoshia eiseniae TaxID=2064768 RepID=A0A2S7N2R9_9BACI|nr:DUF1292 domain-containing protein [Pradoshia eiseniae]PQD96324.1 DUF1292 domain-containing protein [Pradoshia eiseniae]